METLIRDVARLRRAQRGIAENEDIAAVREDLERAVSPTVGRAMAARLLGVSQTALDRWIALGEIPAVTTRNGRREVLLPALLDLLEAVDERRRGADDRHPLGAVLRERRASAARLDPRMLLRRGDVRAKHDNAGGHRAAELRALAYHRAVAQRLDDAIVRDALARLRHWRSEEQIHPRYAERWEALLTGPRARLARTLREDSDQAASLRQSSPFAGVLDEQTRRRVLDVVAKATA